MADAIHRHLTALHPGQEGRREGVNRRAGIPYMQASTGIALKLLHSSRERNSTDPNAWVLVARWARNMFLGSLE